MEYTEIPFRNDLKNQSISIVGDPNGVPQHLAFSARYIEPLGKWQMTVTNVDTGESICRGITLVGSRYPHDLLAPFHHKKCGSLFCVPRAETPDRYDPGEWDIEDFAVIWGDTYGR